MPLVAHNSGHDQRERMCRQGLVVFFPSFSYAEEALGHWQRSGALAALSQHKQVFRWRL